MYAGSGIFWPRIGAGGRVDDRMAQIKREFEATGGTVVEVTKPRRDSARRLAHRAGARVHPERNWGALGKVRSPAGDVEDTVPEDMTLVVQTNQGLVYLFGCGHAGVINTLEHARKTIDPLP